MSAEVGGHGCLWSGALQLFKLCSVLPLLAVRMALVLLSTCWDLTATSLPLGFLSTAKTRGGLSSTCTERATVACLFLGRSAAMPPTCPVLQPTLQDAAVKSLHALLVVAGLREA